MQATASLFRSPFDMRPAHLEHHKSTEIEAIGQAKYLTKGQDEPKKQKSHSEEWLNCLILLVPPNGIEPLPDDYKSTARPSCYGGPSDGAGL